MDNTNLDHANKTRGLISNLEVCRVFHDELRVVITSILGTVIREISLGRQSSDNCA